MFQMLILKKIALFFLDFVETIITALVIFVIFYLFLFQPHQVNGSSMHPAFENEEYLLTNKIVYRFKTPQRGDIVVFQAPHNKKYDYIKRIIGMPGEKVNLENGRIFINNSELDESIYLDTDLLTPGSSFLNEGGEINIPESQYFVIGDNRLHSSDSREWGTINIDSIIGRAWLRYWPAGKLGFIPTITP